MFTFVIGLFARKQKKLLRVRLERELLSVRAAKLSSRKRTICGTTIQFPTSARKNLWNHFHVQDGCYCIYFLRLFPCCTMLRERDTLSTRPTFRRERSQKTRKKLKQIKFCEHTRERENLHVMRNCTLIKQI